MPAVDGAAILTPRKPLFIHAIRMNPSLKRNYAVQGEDTDDKDLSKMNLTHAPPALPADSPRNGHTIIAALDPDIQARIGRKLMAAYDEILQLPIPDRFLQLLEQLDEKTVAGIVANPDKGSGK